MQLCPAKTIQPPPMQIQHTDVAAGFSPFLILCFFFFLFSLCFSLFHPPSHISDLARSTKKIQMLLQYWSSHRMMFGAYHQCEPSRPGRINIFHRWSPQFSSASNSQLVCSIIINTVQCLHTSPHQRSIPSTYK